MKKSKQLKWQYKMLQEGRCSRCGKVNPDKQQHCESCRKNDAARGKARFEALKAAGICVTCKLKNDSENGCRCKLCVEYALKINKENRARRAKLPLT